MSAQPAAQGSLALSMSLQPAAQGSTPRESPRGTKVSQTYKHIA